MLSGLWIICGIAALFDVPAVHFNHKPVLGVLGFVTSIVLAAVPPLVVLGWRKLKGKQMVVVQNGDESPNTSLERTRER